MGSNCYSSTDRWGLVNKLEAVGFPVDTYGRCGKMHCPGSFAMDCGRISNYKFYLAFENAPCKEYITEKVWWNAYHKGAVPVVLGELLCYWPLDTYALKMPKYKS